jgi:hypothetical protein
MKGGGKKGGKGGVRKDERMKDARGERGGIGRVGVKKGYGMWWYERTIS